MRHRGQHLRRSDVRAAEHADLPVRIGKRRRPFDGVVAVLRLVLERIELSLRVEPSTYVLLDDDIARRREIASLLPSAAPIVRRALEKGGEAALASRPVDVRDEDHAITGLH